MNSLHSKATPNPNHLVPPPPVLSDPRAVFDRLMGIAGLARALDPSLPPCVRFYRRAEASEDTRNEASFGIVFTTHRDAIGMAQEDELEFWPAIEKTIPQLALEAEKENLLSAPSYKFASPLDAAVYGAHRDGVIAVKTVPSADPEWVIQSTNGKVIPEMDFLSEPSLSRWLYLTPTAKVDEDSRASPGLTRSRSRVQTLMDVLSRPYENSSADEKNRVSEAFQALEAKKKSSFEFNHQHGWIGYALAKGASGWTAPLLALGASAHIPYNGVQPIVWATAVDDSYSIGALAQADAPVAMLMGSAPKVYDKEHQEYLDGRMGRFSSLLGLAAVVGASRATAALCQKGADINHMDGFGATPLHQACRDNNEGLARVLIHQGARLDIEDKDGNIPSECIPFHGESMFNWMEALRLGQEHKLAPSNAPTLNLSDESRKERLPWVDDVDDVLKNRSRKPSA